MTDHPPKPEESNTILTTLESAGIAPFARAYERTHQIHLIQRLFHTATDQPSETIVKLAGRIMGWKNRADGCIIWLEDMTGQLPASAKVSILGDERYKQFQYLSMGDVVGFEGRVFRTKRGELSLLVDDFELLSKALAPIPQREEWRAQPGPDRYHKERQLDLLLRPELRDTIALRMRVINHLRRWLDARGYHEVETPTLTKITTEVPARLLQTSSELLGAAFTLRNSSILRLNTLIAGGFEQVFEIGRCFRNVKVDDLNTPEYTLLSLAKAFTDYREFIDLLQKLTVGLVKAICKGTKVDYNDTAIEFQLPWPVLTVNEALDEYLDLDVTAYPGKEDLVKAAQACACNNITPEARRGVIIKEIFEEKVVPELINPTFITEFPVEVSPLARACAHNPTRAERAVLYIATHIIADGSTVIIDPRELEQRFEAIPRNPLTGAATALLANPPYRELLKYGLPPTAALWYAIERIVMILAGSQDVNDVQLFPY